MIRTKSLVSELTEIPRVWVFEHYLGLSEKLTGQDVKIKSIFKPTEKTPSMFIFYSAKHENYRFKDFSTGKSGDAIQLVQVIFELSTRGEAAHKIIEDYNQYVLTNKENYTLREFKVQSKYKVSDFKVRSWNTLDEKYWTKFYISSKLLDGYCIKPLDNYKLTKEEDGEEKVLNIKGNYIYGYFRKDGSLYKIYQPMVKDSKFIKVKDYIQGSEQLTGDVPYLVICSSMKDILAFNKLGYKNAEAIAPDSEGVLISEHVLNAYMHTYKSVVTLFDNDPAGIASMEKYSTRYGIKSVHLKLSKDLSDSVRDFNLTKVRDALTPLLKKAVKKEPSKVSADIIKT